MWNLRNSCLNNFSSFPTYKNPIYYKMDHRFLYKHDEILFIPITYQLLSSATELLATFAKLVPEIYRFVHNYIRLFAIVAGIILDDFDHVRGCQLSFQIVASVGTNDDEKENDNLIRSTSDAIKDSDQCKLIEN